MKISASGKWAGVIRAPNAEIWGRIAILVILMAVLLTSVWGAFWAAMLRREGREVTVCANDMGSVGRAVGGAERRRVRLVWVDSNGGRGEKEDVVVVKPDATSAPYSYYELSGPVVSQGRREPLPAVWYYAWLPTILNGAVLIGVVACGSFVGRGLLRMRGGTWGVIVVVMSCGAAVLWGFWRTAEIREYVVSERINREARARGDGP